MSEFFGFAIDFKTNAHAYYAYRQTWPNKAALAPYMSRYTNPKFFHNFRIADYGWNKGSYWFLLADDPRGELNGVITLTPRVTRHAGSVVWLCGYAARKDTGKSAEVRTTIKKQYLPGICQ
ncbi:MAG: hypothetical protein R3240_09725 [Gammaproteobacteria bacterium]|nr:hypothetical protein [Gammaproteobacteria bacterium]